MLSYLFMRAYTFIYISTAINATFGNTIYCLNVYWMVYSLYFLYILNWLNNLIIRNQIEMSYTVLTLKWSMFLPGNLSNSLSLSSRTRMSHHSIKRYQYYFFWKKLFTRKCFIVYILSIKLRSVEMGNIIRLILLPFVIIHVF